ncbi:MAG: helix-turn-helix transcriptional regulator [Halarcobacter ebronensis]|uniref:helix-turn-helix transcriptional regulator n=1 Tax=Halarcobacter ebronensis TaxID=1462615 RepID=UPI003C786D62
MNEKLELIRANLSLNKQEFCKKLNITYQTYQNYLNGRDISTDVAIKLNENFNININWLLTGKGTMFEYEVENKLSATSYKDKLIEDINKLSTKKQEYYYHRIKADLIEEEIYNK